jgi:hypothetical protein
VFFGTGQREPLVRLIASGVGTVPQKERQNEAFETLAETRPRGMGRDGGVVDSMDGGWPQMPWP